jgi:hypothetical protein
MPSVDFSRLSLGEMVAGLGGAALLGFMFLPWYGGTARVELPGGGDITAQGQSLNAWQSFALIDLALFLAAVLAVGVAVARAAGAIPAHPATPPGVIVLSAGALAVFLILYRVIDSPSALDTAGLAVDFQVDREVGIFLSLLAAAGIAVGGYTALTEAERPERRRSPPPTA